MALMKTRHEIAREFGYTYRSCLDGGFINQGGDDLMKIDNKNEVTVYAHNAEAFMVAKLVAATPK